MRLDAIAKQRHFLDHIAPVWRALPEEARGHVITTSQLVGHAKRLGMRATTDYGPPAPTLVAAMGDQRDARDNGRTTLARIEHGIGQAFREPDASYAGGPGSDDVDLFLMPNQYSASRWAHAYPRARVEVVGSPHIDSLPARVPGPGPVIALSFHWRGLAHVPETGSAISTYAGGLTQLAKQFTILGHGHPRMMPNLIRYYRLAGIKPVFEFEEVCRRADVYVCDSASTLYEFASTGRPVVVLNAPNYYRGGERVEHGLRFWEAATVGVQCETAAGLPDAIRAALADPPDQQAAREAALDLVYAYRDGRAAERAAAILAEWAGGFTTLTAAAPPRMSQAQRKAASRQRTPADRVAALRASA